MTHDETVERTALRHVLATLAYRTVRATENLPPAFAHFSAHPGSRTPVAILAHMGDLFDWALSMASGHEQWGEAAPLEWEEERVRFHNGIRAFDAYIAGPAAVACPLTRLLQGPLADAMTHAGQLAMLRHMFGQPMKGENYFVADIAIGRIGMDQPAPRKPFR